jgi:Ca2+-binding EF-hand superfamily protein
MVNAGYRLTAANALKHPWVEKKIASWKLPPELVVSFDLFGISKPLKRIALYALAKKSPPSKYRELFTQLDTTESGTLTQDEFMVGFRHSGSSPEELEALFEKLDVNCNGEMLYTEFLAATLEAEGELEEAQLQEAFDLIARKSKYIGKKDVSKLVGKDSDKSRLHVIAGGVGVTMDSKKDSNKDSDKDRLSVLVDECFKEKSKYSYEDFAELFEHGFDSGCRTIDSIIETSLNEDQLSRLKQDDFRKHMSAIEED